TKPFVPAVNAFLMEKSNIPRKNPLIWNMRFGYVFLNILEK
ncbi:Macrodomain Ter protein, partial [Haemophilus influenzae]